MAQHYKNNPDNCLYLIFMEIWKSFALNNNYRKMQLLNEFRAKLVQGGMLSEEHNGRIFPKVVWLMDQTRPRRLYNKRSTIWFAE